MHGHQYQALGEEDLTPEQLEGMDLWDRDVMLDERHRAIGALLVRRAVAEIRRRRAAQHLDATLVRHVVIEAIKNEPWLRHEEGIAGINMTAIADRVAAQLATATPVLDRGTRDVLLRLYLMVPTDHLTSAQREVLDRLLAPAPGEEVTP